MGFSLGTRLGPYEVVSQLGAGGMGEVYRARDARLEREVVIKVLPLHLAFNPEARGRFEREARAIAALTHPNILSIHDFGIEGDTVFAVMELLHSETLRERLETGNGAQSVLPTRKVLDIAIQVARGLAAAHGKSVVHRDLKPENVFLTTDGQVKILDSGLARVVVVPPCDGTSPTTLGATCPGTVMGTAGYMPVDLLPERQGRDGCDHLHLECRRPGKTLHAGAERQPSRYHERWEDSGAPHHRPAGDLAGADCQLARLRTTGRRPNEPSLPEVMLGLPSV